jgi:integrase
MVFIRSKTAREKKKNPRLITIIITKEIGRIIDRWGNKPGNPDDYIFPILDNGLTAQQQYARVQQTTKMINKYINAIGDKISLPHRITSYTARHSFATVLKRSGASIEFISESLGHSNLATTENYLADFEIAEKKKWANKLANF